MPYFRAASIARRPLLALGGTLLFESTRLAAGALVGCSAPSTGGGRVTLTNLAGSDLSRSPAHDNAFGWRVEITAGKLALAHLYYVTGPAATLAQRTLALPAAHAHPGHYAAGDVLGELGEQVTLDLLASPVTLAATPGVTGYARSAVVTFGELARENGAAVLVKGLATRGGEARRFSARVERAAIVNATSGLPEVEGCPLSGGRIRGDGNVQLEVHTALWVDQIDFSEVPASDDPFQLEPDTPPHNAFRRGIQKAIAYQFSYSSA